MKKRIIGIIILVVVFASFFFMVADLYGVKEAAITFGTAFGMSGLIFLAVCLIV